MVMIPRVSRRQQLPLPRSVHPPPRTRGYTPGLRFQRALIETLILAVPAPAAVLPYHQTVGILGTGGTTVSMTPADLAIMPRTDITNFTVVLDAGVY